MNETIENKTIDTKEKNNITEQFVFAYLSKLKNPFAILSAQDIAQDLHIGINQAYDLLKQPDFPTINIGRRKTVTLASYLLWKMNKKGGV